MSFLLDTNVISEMVNPRRNDGVEAFLSSTPERDMAISVISIAEIRDGVDRMRRGTPRDKLALWLEHGVPIRFKDRIIKVDEAVADVWGRYSAVHYFSQRNINVMDGFIAATAAVHGLTVVTRNVRDFIPLGVSVLNPWTDV